MHRKKEAEQAAAMWHAAMEGKDSFYDESGVDATLCSCCERDRADISAKQQAIEHLQRHDVTRIAMARREVAKPESMFNVLNAGRHTCNDIDCLGCGAVLDTTVEKTADSDSEDSEFGSDWEADLENDPTMQELVRSRMSQMQLDQSAADAIEDIDEREAANMIDKPGAQVVLFFQSAQTNVADAGRTDDIPFEGLLYFSLQRMAASCSCSRFYRILGRSKTARIDVFPPVTVTLPALLCFSRKPLVKVEGTKALQEHFSISSNPADWDSRTSDLYHWLDKAGVFVAQSDLPPADEDEGEDNEEETHYCEEESCPLRSMYMHQHVDEKLFGDASKMEEFFQAV